MKEQRISLKTAKLAKEKGFDQHPFRAAYDNYQAYYPEYKDGSGDIVLKSPLFNLEHVIAMAPTQSILQKWLREKYLLHIEVHREEDDWEYEIYEFAHGNKHIPTGFKTHSTFEEALEEGLFEALKLIK